MTDTAIITALAKTALQEISKQATALGTGLLNAAPGDRVGSPNPSVQYLLETSELLAKFAEECDKIHG